MPRPKNRTHVTVNNLKFNFGDSLQQAIVEGWDSRKDLSPPLTPILDGVAFGDLPDFLDLSDLSPLTSPEASPPQTPLNYDRLDRIAPESNQVHNKEARAHCEQAEDRPIPYESPHEILAAGEITTASTDRKAKRKSRRHAAYRAWRKKTREDERLASDSHYEGHQNAREKYVDTAAPIITDYATQEASAASTGYVGLDDHTRSKKVYTLDELVGDKSKFKFKLVKWDGRKTMSILDKDRRIVAILAGCPDDPDWQSVHAEAAAALEAQRNQVHVSKKKVQHRRGRFPALRCGISHGGGQRKPSNLQNHPINDGILHDLNHHKSFQRLAGFASSVMATWTPDLHKYYTQTIDDLLANDPTLVRIFPSSAFCAASYNFGPRTACYRHKDFANLPFGLCAVASLGTFDPTKGGHMILWDFGLVIEFPPGSTILLPSAIVAHCNTSISQSERRYSFAQYTAGGLFRWVDNQYSTRETYLSNLTPEEREMDDKKNEARWAFGLSLLPIVPEAKKTTQ